MITPAQGRSSQKNAEEETAALLGTTSRTRNELEILMLRYSQRERKVRSPSALPPLPRTLVLLGLYVLLFRLFLLLRAASSVLYLSFVDFALRREATLAWHSISIMR